jgi:hypothetical protein
MTVSQAINKLNSHGFKVDENKKLIIGNKNSTGANGTGAAIDFLREKENGFTYVSTQV